MRMKANPVTKSSLVSMSSKNWAMMGASPLNSHQPLTQRLGAQRDRDPASPDPDSKARRQAKDSFGATPKRAIRVSAGEDGKCGGRGLGQAKWGVSVSGWHR